MPNKQVLVPDHRLEQVRVITTTDLTEPTKPILIKPIVFLVLIAFFTFSPSVAFAQDPRTGTDAEQTFFDFQVEQAARVKNAQKPSYPERLRSANVEGQVLVQFVVDERGIPVMSTFKVLKSTHADLTESVRSAVTTTSFHAAEVRGQRVRQLVQQPFIFAVRSRQSNP